MQPLPVDQLAPRELNLAMIGAEARTASIKLEASEQAPVRRGGAALTTFGSLARCVRFRSKIHFFLPSSLPPQRPSCARVAHCGTNIDLFGSNRIWQGGGGEGGDVASTAVWQGARGMKARPSLRPSQTCRALCPTLLGCRPRKRVFPPSIQPFLEFCQELVSALTPLRNSSPSSPGDCFSLLKITSHNHRTHKKWGLWNFAPGFSAAPTGPCCCPAAWISDVMPS